ncbi:MAG: glycosyltransferase family 2 protein [Acidobacteriota bacterium]|nr:glycosyltransferase family 2 protein [Acidobacteriota bacterium]
MSLATPVAFIIFNRPELTEEVFGAISAARPAKLLVVADGPRSPQEAERCERARAVVANITWDCEVLTNFADANLGCRRRVSSGLDWVFSQVEEAIILEDDCLPAPSFFGYCEGLLERYREDERVMHVGGDNFQRGRRRADASYYFSRYCHIWGWASWSRAWRHYDVAMRTWPAGRELIRGSFADEAEADFWAGIFDRVHAGQIDTWDYQWVYACWSQSGLAVVPEVNLVSNVGFGPDATHTRGESEMSQLPVSDIGELRHPRLVIRNSEADDYSFDHVFGGLELKERARAAASRSRLSTARRVAGSVLRRFRHG